MSKKPFFLVRVNNPFEPRDRDTRALECDGRPLIAHLPVEPGVSLVFSVNGRVVAREEAAARVPKCGDYIVMCPVLGKGGGGGGKNPLQIIATLALTAVSFGVGAWASAAWGTTAGMLATGAVMALGGNLLSNMGPKPKVDMPTFAADQSAFEGGYGWDQMRPLMNQGGPIQLTYGTVRVAGQCLGQHVTTDGKTQFLNLLLSGGEGPVDSISGLKINGNPVTNFDATVDGLLDTKFTQAMATGAAVVKTTAADSTNGFEVELTFPNGLALSGWGRAAVTVLIEYSVHGAGSYSTAYNETFTGWQLQSLTHSWRKDGLPSAKYDVRVTITANASGKAVQWTRLSDVNYSENVDIETRLGTNDQAAISFFSDTYADQLFQAELVDSDWSAYQTEGNGGAGLEIEFTFPQGLCYVNDDGSPSETWVKIDVQYRLVGAGSWSNWGTFEIRDDEQRPVRRAYRLNNLTPGQYEVQCKVNSVAGSTSRYVNSCFWSRLTHIVYDDFRYPNMALVGIRAMATDKLSGGMPSISWSQTRSNVWVYVPGVGYQQKTATNPAWICYDMIHRARSLKNVQTGTTSVEVFGEPASKIDYSAFSAWASFCDALVDGLKRCEVNLFIDAAGRIWEQMQKVAAMGRGHVLLRGTGYTAIFDGSATPVQLFTIGNIESGSLTGEFLETADRADAVEISFLNEDKDYQRDTIIVYGDDYDTSSNLNSPAQVFLPGITDYRRAYREGLYRLRLNKYLKRSISFRADIDAIACQVGDVILVQHDVPRWGQGGRLVSATSNSVTLDKSVTLLPGTTYQVKIRLSDDTLVEKTVSAVLSETTTATIGLTTSFTTTPAAFDVYAFGESGLTSKPFRITKITRSGEQKARIDALEYYANVYDETATVPTIDYTVSLPTVRNLQIGFHFDKAGQGILDILWSAPTGAYGGAIVEIDGKSVAKLGMTQTEYHHPVNEDKTYTVTVTGLSAAGTITGPVFASYTVNSIEIPTVTWGNVTEGNSYYLANGSVAVDLDCEFTIPEYRNFKGVAIYYQVDGAGLWYKAGETSTNTFTIRSLKVPTGSSIQVDARIINRWNTQGASSLSTAHEITAAFAPPAALVSLDLESGADVQEDGTTLARIDGTYVSGGGTSWVTAEIGTGDTPTDWKEVTQSNSGTFTIRGVALNTLFSVRVTPRNLNGAGPGITDTILSNSDITPPLKPATPTLSILFKNIRVKCLQNATKAADMAGFKIFRNTTNNSGTATEIGWVGCGGNDDGVVLLDEGTAYGATYYYWTKAVDRTGNVSVFSDAAGPVTTSQIVSGDLSAGSVCAMHINAAGISADCLTAGTICADRITALNGTTGYGGVTLGCAIQNQGKNILPDPDFRGVPFNADYVALCSGVAYGEWVPGNVGTGVSYSVHKQATTRSAYVFPGSNGIWFYGTTTANYAGATSATMFPVKPGASYDVSAYVSSHCGYNCPRFYMGLYFYDAAGNSCGGSDSNIICACTGIPNVPTKMGACITIPAGVAYAKMRVLNCPTASSYLYVSAASVVERDATTATSLPWSAGESGTITANRVIAGALRSLNWDSDSGSYFDLNGGTFCLGGSSAPKLKWDGTTLTVNGVVCATSGCFSGTITSTAGTIGGWTIGTSLLCASCCSNGVWLQVSNCRPVIYSCGTNGSVASYAMHGAIYKNGAYQNAWGFSATQTASGDLAFAAGLVTGTGFCLPDSGTALTSGCPFFWVGTSTSYMKWYNGLLTLNGSFRITRCASDITGPWICLINTCTSASCANMLCIVSSSNQPFWLETCGSVGIGLKVISRSDYGIDTSSTRCYGIYASAGCGYAIFGCSGGTYGVYGYAQTSYPVAGNGAYYNSSTRALKTAFEDVEVLPGLRCLCIQKWTWNDQNMRGFDEFIGPVAEDVQAAFRLTFANEGVYQLDGIALKAAQELDACITAQNACIESLAVRLANIESRLSQCA